MDDKSNWLQKIAASGGSIMIALTTVPLKEAGTTLSSNLDWLGITTPTWLDTETAQRVVFYVGLVLVAVWLIGAIQRWLRPNKVNSDTTSFADRELIERLFKLAVKLRRYDENMPANVTEGDIQERMRPTLTKTALDLQFYAIILAPGCFSESFLDIADRLEAIGRALERGDIQAAKEIASDPI